MVMLIGLIGRKKDMFINFSMDGAEELTALSASQCQLIISILHSHALGSQPSS